MEKTRFLIDNYVRPDEAFHFARKSLETRYPARAHDHDYFEVFLIENGRTEHWVNGVTQTLEPGQLVFMRPKDVHAFNANRKTGCQIINVMFRTETATHLARRYHSAIGDRFFDASSDLPEMHTLGPARFARAVNVSLQLQTAQRDLARIEEFLLVLTNRVAHATSGVTKTAPKWFSEACSAAQSAEVFRLGTKGFIRAAGRSQEHVCRTCKIVLGITPTEFINRIRIEHAAQLLRSDEASINDIIASCGFENTGYFYRLFRRHYDTTPKSFRSRYQRDPFQSRVQR